VGRKSDMLSDVRMLGQRLVKRFIEDGMELLFCGV